MLLFLLLFKQQSIASSTIKKLPNPALDRFNEIVEQVPQIIFNEKETALKLIKEGLLFANVDEFIKERALLLNQLGIYHYLNADYGKSVLVLDSAIEINKKHGQIQALVNNLNNKGYVF